MSDVVVKTWQTLKQAGLTIQDDLPSMVVETPWFIRLLQGFAGWLAALFIVAFIGVSFWSFFEQENAAVMITLAVIAHAVAWPMLSKRSNEFLDQLGLAVSLAGQFLMALGLMMSFSYEGRWAFIILGVYQLVLVYWMPNAIHRFLSALFAVLSLTWGLNNSFAMDWIQLAFTVSVVMIFLYENRWGNRRDLLQPLAYGLACGALLVDGVWLSGAYLWVSQQIETVWVFPWIHMLVSIALLIFVLYQIMRSGDHEPISGFGLSLLVIAAATAGVVYYVTGSLNSLLILLLGFYRKRPILLMIGVLTLIGFVSWYYYSLHISLLRKSLILLSSGGAFIMLWFAIGLTFKHLQPQQIQQDNTSRNPHSGWIMVAMCVIILATLNVSVFGKESLLRHGQTVLLKLAPVDPRSLMQGDYMRLRYAIEAEYMSSRETDDQTDGALVVSLDAENVAQFIRRYQGGQLTDGETLLRFRMRGQRLRLGTDAFFFQEGTASVYEQAEYGDFRVSEKGDMMLVGLRDAKYAVLGRQLF